ncbi:L-Aspartase-like protein [Flagelloscypha sp. PMI_526]|nr:L-Aspartase-like protein [Flagelloscypha sp. PMI_526]
MDLTSASTLMSPPNTALPLLHTFLQQQRELAAYKSGEKTVLVDGQTLSIAAVNATARFCAPISLDETCQGAVSLSRQVIEDKITSGMSVYGLSTGFGGSADTRTDRFYHLGLALVQHLNAGVLPSGTKPLGSFTLSDPLTSTSMPESWVRAAMLVRMNSLIRGHSGVRWEILERLQQLLAAKITPFVPIRTSISASGDLSPLSYIAGTLMGNPSIRVFHGPETFGPRALMSASQALDDANIEKVQLAPKEGLGIVNGTAFSAAVASLALNDAVHVALLSHVLTAMSSEALLGTRANFDPFIQEIRPHSGQVESARLIWDLLEGSQLVHMHEENLSLHDDKYALRQDRYPLRTAPQFLGPQIEDILNAHSAVTLECNSTTDNPLIETKTGIVHHGGNFQAMAVTNAMEKTRLALHHIGKILFAQGTELLNPAFNNGLPPSVAATDPSLNYHAKGLDVALAGYISELGYLANPVSTHIQSAEMHNQSVNSLALISARATINSLETLMLLMSSHLYILCQALDIRALQHELHNNLEKIIAEELESTFPHFTSEVRASLRSDVISASRTAFDKCNTMDGQDRMRETAGAGLRLILRASTVSSRGYSLLQTLRSEYLSGARGAAPASNLIGATKVVYRYVRETLKIPMHGRENLSVFEHGLNFVDQTIGQNVSLIYEAMRDGHLQPVIADLMAPSLAPTKSKGINGVNGINGIHVINGINGYH